MRIPILHRKGALPQLAHSPSLTCASHMARRLTSAGTILPKWEDIGY